MKVKKRDGRITDFEKTKITDAIMSAMEETGSVNYRTAKRIANEISKVEKEIIEIEEIQDLVEEKLMASSYKDVAKAYILYRNERTKERNKNSELTKEINSHLMADNVQNQNANVDEFSFGGRKGEAANALLKQYALDYIMSPMARDNHLNNEIYTHDLDNYAIGTHNCLSVPFDDLLANGFNTRQTDVRPANSINTAFQLVAVIFQLQSLQQFGGVSATHIDWTMVPYVRKSFYKHFKDAIKYIPEVATEVYASTGPGYAEDGYPITHSVYSIYPKRYQYAMDKTEQELKQAVEGMYHNLNTLQSRSGNQLPFTSINYGTCTLPEGRMVTKALLEGCIKGVGKFHKTSIFPCGIFQYMRGINDAPGTPNYDLYRLALQSTAKRLYPNYANVDWSGNAGYDRNDPKTYFSTMGCRTANGFDINHDPDVNPQTKDGRGNICPVTIILPTLAMEAASICEQDEHINQDNFKYWSLNKNALIETFMTLLDQKIHEAKDQLIERFEYICSQPSESAKFMYENHTMLGYDGKDTRSALKHGTLALGQIGMAETLEILIGTDQTTPEGMELAKRIEQLFKDRCTEFKNDYHLNFGVYFTPAENLCFTAMKKFKSRYGKIPNVSDRDYFTNSIHVPVWRQVSPFEKIDIESQLTGYSSAGCITYVELDGGMENNIDGLEAIVNYAMSHDIPYFAINVPNDTCLTCGYTGEFDDTCPECGGHDIQHLRRVTGYLTGDYKTAFNPGKQKETEDRFRHSQLKVY